MKRASGVTILCLLALAVLCIVRGAGAQAEGLPKYGITVERVACAVKCWRVVALSHLTAEENNGGHNVYVEILGIDGKRVYWAPALIGWPSAQPQEIVANMPTKPIGEKFATDFPLFKDQVVRLWIGRGADDYPSDVVLGIHTGHPDEAPGNTLYHHSFAVMFQLTDASTPTPTATPTSTATATRTATATAMPVTTPTSTPTPAGDVGLEDIRRAAWDMLRPIYNKEAAFQKYARLQSLGVPLTAEFDFSGYRAQGYSGAIVYCPAGQWDRVAHMAW